MFREEHLSENCAESCTVFNLKNVRGERLRHSELLVEKSNLLKRQWHLAEPLAMADTINGEPLCGVAHEKNVLS